MTAREKPSILRGESGNDLLELVGRASQLSPEKLGQLANELHRLSSRARTQSNLFGETAEAPLRTATDESDAKEQGKTQWSGLGLKDEHEQMSFPEQVSSPEQVSLSEQVSSPEQVSLPEQVPVPEGESPPALSSSNGDVGLPADSHEASYHLRASDSARLSRLRRPRSRTSPVSSNAGSASDPTPRAGSGTIGSKFQGLMKRAALKFSRDGNDSKAANNTQVESDSTEAKDETPSAEPSMRERSGSLVVRRDMYGYEVEAELLDSYSEFMGRAIDDLQLQMDNFEALVSEFRSELLVSELDEDSVCDDSQVGVRHHHRGFVQEPSPSCRERLKELAKNGVPAKYRTMLWTTFCGQRVIIDLSSGIYERLLQDHAGETTQHTEQIERDIPRTFPGTIGAFSRESLRRVLTAYSWRDPAVGYCQSMNFIVAGLLTFLDEENSFWILCYISDKLLPEYFGTAVIGVLADAQILGELTKDRLPAIYAHFRRVGFDMRLLASQWFMTLFSYVLPNECAFRVWDIAFIRGAEVLFEVALGLLAMCEERLLQASDAPEVALIFHEFTRRQFDLFPVLHAFSHLKPVDRAMLTSLRRDRIRELLEAQRITSQAEA